MVKCTAARQHQKAAQVANLLEGATVHVEEFDALCCVLSQHLIAEVPIL